MGLGCYYYYYSVLRVVCTNNIQTTHFVDATTNFNGGECGGCVYTIKLMERRKSCTTRGQGLYRAAVQQQLLHFYRGGGTPPRDYYVQYILLLLPLLLCPEVIFAL